MDPFPDNTAAYARLRQYAQEHKLTLRRAAYCLVLEKVFAGMALRGVQ